jgi:hypothetical protein
VTVSVINLLLQEGALVRPGGGRSPVSGWADPVEHARMLHDDRRTGDYLAALAEAVQPGEVVLDGGYRERRPVRGGGSGRRQARLCG